MWAAYHLWNDEIVEYFNNDVSPQINLLSELITKGKNLKILFKILLRTFMYHFSEHLKKNIKSYDRSLKS